MIFCAEVLFFRQDGLSPSSQGRRKTADESLVFEGGGRLQGAIGSTVRHRSAS